VEHISAADIAEVLKGAEFPARKNDLVAVAIRNNPVIQALEQLPGREFNSVTEVEEAFPARNEGQGPIKLQRLERYGGRSKSLPFPSTAVRRWSAPLRNPRQGDLKRSGAIHEGGQQGEARR
jgi:Protein of unknown function (DUF2795)